MTGPSPFPGMNPYLEQEWVDVHASLAIYTRDRLQPRLGKDLRIRAEKRVFVEDEGSIPSTRRVIAPDVAVIEEWQTRHASQSGSESIAVADPLIVPLPSTEVTQRYLKIIDISNGNQVVTVIEFLSPTNKRPGEGRKKYQEKRQECIEAGVNFVEIDLSRAGERELLIPPHRIPRSHQETYQTCVYRAAKSEQAELYAMSLWSPLPTISIPLRPQDDDVPLELQALIDEICERGRYEFDYSAPCDPELNPADAQELARRLAE